MGKKKGRRPAKAAQGFAGKKRSNPFESLGSVRLKHNVLNKRVRGANRNPNARLQANLKRKKTLLLELQNQSKQNKFVDKRFGEREEISQEEKDFLRFQRERQKRSKSKGSRFSLQDNEELTHMGMSLSKAQDVSVAEDEEDDDDEQLDMKLIDEYTNLGSGNGQRTKKEILAEIIAKRNAEKMRRKELQEEQASLLASLDDDLAEIRKLGDFKQTKSKMDKIMGRTPEPEPENPQVDEFRAMTRRLAMDMRARATERLKTPEELAQEQKERLEKLEADRLRRMNPENYNGGGGGEETGSKPTDDDLVVNYVVEDENDMEGTAGVLDVGAAPKSKVKSKALRSQKKNKKNRKGGDSDDDDEEGAYRHSSEAIESARIARKELPYIFNAPSNYKDFKKVLSEHCTSAEEFLKIVHRIRVYNSVTISKENKPKLQLFVKILMKHFTELCKLPSSASSSSSSSSSPSSSSIPSFSSSSSSSSSSMLMVSKLIDKRLSYIEVFPQALHELSAQLPKLSATIFRENFSGMMLSLSSSSAGAGFPTSEQLFMMQLAATLFPTSDFKHNVTVPMIHLIAHFLTTCPIRGGRDVFAANFLCRILLFSIQESKRYIPELTGFITELVLVGVGQDNSTTLPCVFEEKSSVRGMWQGLSDDNKKKKKNDKNKKNRKEIRKKTSNGEKKKKKGASTTLSGLHRLFLQNNHQEFTREETSLAALRVTLRTLSSVVDIYRDLETFPELFEALIPILSKISINQDDQDLVMKLVNKIQAGVKRCLETRLPLILKVIKPKQIQQFNPEITDNFQPGKDKDNDRERVERKKLQKKIKREKKHAMRALQRDSVFIARERQRVAAQQANEAARKRKRIRSEMEREMADTNVHAFKSRKKRGQ